MVEAILRNTFWGMVELKGCFTSGGRSVCHLFLVQAFPFAIDMQAAVGATDGLPNIDLV